MMKVTIIPAGDFTPHTIADVTSCEIVDGALAIFQGVRWYYYSLMHIYRWEVE